MIRIDEPIEQETYNRFFAFVSEEKRARIKRFHFIEDAKRTLYGELLIRYLACDRLKIANNGLVIDCNEFGKLFLREYPSFHFNISHSGDWVACAISEKEVGIDIEKIKSIDLDIAKRFFSDTEYKMLMSQPEDFKINYFYGIWTLKESYIKCIGKGLSVLLNSFSICVEKMHVTLATGLIAVYLSKISIDDNYKLSVCSKENLFAEKIDIIKINDIEERLFHGN